MTNTQNTPPAGAEESRALDADELQMADMARHPALGQLSDRELSDLISRLRSRRNRARRKAPSGALDHAGELPSRERSRTRY